MSSTVTLQINSQRLIKNLMFSFTNKTTFLSELMQNARRAGATFVRFSFDEVWPNTLVVEDDGGIANLQNLLTIAESGWMKLFRRKKIRLVWALCRLCSPRNVSPCIAMANA